MGLESFSEFCNRMHQDYLYLTRRETNYKDLGLSYNEYLDQNLNFLYEQYERQKSEQVRETMDGFDMPARVYSL
jgi:hypothetical protein